MKEASGWFFVGALAVGIAQSTGALQAMERMLIPMTTHWLQLPPEAATAFIMGVVRRHFGAAGLYHMTLTPMQVTVALITITLFVPCIASLIVMMKERGLKERAYHLDRNMGCGICDRRTCFADCNLMHHDGSGKQGSHTH